MKAMLLIYLLLCIYESFGHATFRENDETKKTALLPSTTSGKQLKIIRDILNQESLARFSMIQKIETLVMDAIDSKNFSQALEKRLSEVVKELGDLKINDDILNEENTKLKDEIKDLYLILNNYTTVESANVESLNDSEILYLMRKTLFVENQIQTLSLQNLDINKQLVFLMKRDLNSLKNETIGLNEKYDKMLQENYAFQNQSTCIMNGRKSTRLIERLLSMENGLQTLLESFNKTMENYHPKATDVKANDFRATNCEKGWVQFEENCYLFLRMEYNFKDAVDYCNRAAAGAHLLEIKSSHVEKWINLQLTIRGFQYTWIGLTDILNQGSFVLISTGSKPTYTNWHKNEPNNSGNVEHCVEKWNTGLKWNDKRCDTRRSFVCEMGP
ncbi:C-type lectin domain family 4 member M-like isoform X3 [Saccostrea cucullata]|uniref:C-type lectin domain family 4 member M-like isoform X3 n=1 Tax=Saccostrea cuccullata TaxID=36930 RepID=UPI002ED59C52